MVMKKMYSRNATKSPSDSAPDATRAPPTPKDEHEGALCRKGRGRLDHGIEPRDAYSSLVRRLRLGRDAVELPLLGAARLDGPDGPERPLEARRHPADALLGALRT